LGGTQGQLIGNERELLRTQVSLLV